MTLFELFFILLHTKKYCFMSYVLLIVGFVLLTFAADWLVNGASGLAKRLNVSELVIGLTIVAFGTSAPELVVNVVATAKGTTDIALTNVLGSNIFNVLIILGISVLVYPIACQKNTFRYEIPLSVLAGAIVLLLAQDGNLQGFDGAILLAIFVGFLVYAVSQAKKNVSNDAEESTQSMKIWKAILLVIVGLGGLVVGGNLIVDNAVVIAKSWGLSEAVIGVTIVAAGTSLPELATSVVAALKKNTDLAIGNVIGSNIFNVFFILGLSSSISSLPIYDNFFVDASLAAGSSLLLLLFVALSRKRELNRWTGIIMLGCFLTYVFWLLK